MRKIGKSACYDSGGTAYAMKPEDDYIPTDIPSDKVFKISDGKNLYGSTKALPHHEVREPTRTVGYRAHACRYRMSCSVLGNL